MDSSHPAAIQCAQTANRKARGSTLTVPTTRTKKFLQATKNTQSETSEQGTGWKWALLSIFCCWLALYCYRLGLCAARGKDGEERDRQARQTHPRRSGCQQHTQCMPAAAGIQQRVCTQHGGT